MVQLEQEALLLVSASRRYTVVEASPLILNSTVLVVLTLAKLPTLSVKPAVAPVLNTSVLGNTPDNTPVSDTDTLTVTKRGSAESGVTVKVAVAPATTVSGFSVTVNVTCSNHYHWRRYNYRQEA